MKNLILLTFWVMSAASTSGQTLEFFPNEVRGLEKICTLSGTAGQSTIAKNLWLHNRTGQTLQLIARPHGACGALYFFDGHKTIHYYSIKLSPGAKATIQLFGYLNSPSGQTCTGYVALAATPLNANGKAGLTKNLKIPVKLKFMSPAGKQAPLLPPTFTKPDRYEAVMIDGLPVRWHLKQLPLNVYSKHAHTGDTATQYEAVVRRSVEVWNSVGRENGLTRDFFKIVQKSGQADIRVDWTGKDLLPGSNGSAYPSEGRIGMMPLDQYKGLGRAGETLMQELCHMLGVAHSEVSTDIMFAKRHRYSPPLEKMSATTRDKQILGWLYSQTRYLPLRE